MKIAFTSTDGKLIDRHFAAADWFYVWDVGPEGASFVERTAAAAGDGIEEDRIVARARSLEGCQIVYTMQIGGPAAAKLVARRVQPMKTNVAVPVASVVEKLQEVMRDRPPPWMRKLMGRAPVPSSTTGSDED